MSALPPIADIAGRELNVRFVPKAVSCDAAKVALFDHLVGTAKRQRQISLKIEVSGPQTLAN